MSVRIYATLFAVIGAVIFFAARGGWETPGEAMPARDAMASVESEASPSQVASPRADAGRMSADARPIDVVAAPVADDGLATEVLVRSKDMRPVPGARVTLSGTLTGHAHRGVSDTDGRVVLSRLPAEPSVVSVRAEGFEYSEKVIAHDEEEVVVVLGSGWSLIGNVAVEGGAAPESAVRVSLRPSRYMMLRGVSSGRCRDAVIEVTSQPGGRFEAHNLIEGESYYIFVEDTNYVSIEPVGPIDATVPQPVEVTVARLAAVALEIATGTAGFESRCRSLRTAGRYSYRSLDGNCAPYGTSDTVVTRLGEQWISAAPEGRTRKLILFRTIGGTAPNLCHVQIQVAYGFGQDEVLDMDALSFQNALENPRVIGFDDEAERLGSLRVLFDLPEGSAAVAPELLYRGFRITAQRPDLTGANCSCTQNIDGEGVRIALPEGRWMVQINAMGGTFRWPAEGAFDLEIVESEEFVLHVPTTEVGGVQMLPVEDGVPFTGSAIVRCASVESGQTFFQQFDQAPYLLWGLSADQWELSVSRPDSDEFLVPGSGGWVGRWTVRPGALDRVELLDSGAASPR